MGTFQGGPAHKENNGFLGKQRTKRISKIELQLFRQARKKRTRTHRMSRANLFVCLFSRKGIGACVLPKISASK